MRRLTLKRRRHPAPDQLSRYLDGDLRHDEAKLLEEHLVRCARCRRLLKSLAETVRVLGSLPRPEAPGLADGIIAELRAADAPSAPDAALRGSPGSPQRPLGLTPAGSWLQAARLRLTVPIALVVGTILSLVNQGGMIFAGQIDPGMCAICGLNFVVPFLALSLTLIAAAHIGARGG